MIICSLVKFLIRFRQILEVNNDTVSSHNFVVEDRGDGVWDIAASQAFDAQNHTDAWQQVDNSVLSVFYI